MNSSNPIATLGPETRGQKFRRWLDRADITNAVNSPALVGSTAWIAGTVYVASTGTGLLVRMYGK